MALTEGARNAQFLVSEANNYRSRGAATVVVPANTTLAAGTILGYDTSAEKYVNPDFSFASGDLENQALLYETLVNDTGSAVDHVVTLIERDAEVVGAHLTYVDEADDTAKATANAALATKGIIVR
ncbi:head decoration protein [Henriciella sp.]|uniref:head decoration protein n=1 Tax=Henriciella sp. TaxID=1968823 RepID=UPI00262ADC98|nr:head decoration protein [Henriciella sp.]